MQRLIRNNIGVIALCMLSMSLAGCGGCTYVHPGYMGIKIKLYGSNRGVQETTIVTGRVLYNPWTEQIVEFPTFLQYRAWTANPNEATYNLWREQGEFRRITRRAFLHLNGWKT